MAGWIYLPSLLDKIRLAEAGKLHADYQPNYLYKGFDAKWLETAGLNAEEFVAVVKGTITDGEMADWVRENVEVDEATRDPVLRRFHRCRRGAAVVHSTQKKSAGKTGAYCFG